MAIELVETVEVELVADGSPAVVNKADFNPALHRLPGATPATAEHGGESTAEAPATGGKKGKKTE